MVKVDGQRVMVRGPWEAKIGISGGKSVSVHVFLLWIRGVRHRDANWSALGARGAGEKK